MLFGHYLQNKNNLFFSGLLFLGTGLGVLIGTRFGIYLCKKKPNNKLDKHTIYDIITEAVSIEKEFILDAIPCSLIGMNAELAKQIKELTKEAFLNYLIQHRGIICVTDTFPIWEMYQMVKTIHAIVTNDIDSFQAVLQKIPSLLKRQHIKQQIELLEAAYSNGYAFAKLRLEEHISHNSILVQSPRL